MESSNIQGELSITTGDGRMAEKCCRKLRGDNKELMFEKSRQSNSKQKICTKGFHIFQPSPVFELLLPPALQLPFPGAGYLLQCQQSFCTIFKTWFDLLFEILVFTNSTDIVINCKHKRERFFILNLLGQEILSCQQFCVIVWFTVSSCNLHHRDFTFHFSKWILMPITFSSSVDFL